MPKKVSTMPATKSAKNTRAIAKAETDQNWGKLTKQKKDTKIPTPTQQECSLKLSNDPAKFPHTGFPIRLEYKDGNDKKTCWFQCYDHYIKHITRYKVTDYEAITNDVALVGKSTGAKSKQQRSRSR
jgi:hypothetical protein